MKHRLALLFLALCVLASLIYFQLSRYRLPRLVSDAIAHARLTTIHVHESSHQHAWSGLASLGIVSTPTDDIGHEFYRPLSDFSHSMDLSFVDNTLEQVYQFKVAHGRTLLRNLISELSQRLNHLARNLQKTSFTLRAPLIIVGTAGTGTRVIGGLLEHMSIQMSRMVNKQLDSHVFIQLIKNRPAFCCAIGNASLFGHFVRTRSTDYEVAELDKELRDVLLQGIRDVHLILSFEAFWAARNRRVVWGFKEPQAAFVIPLLKFFYERLHVKVPTRRNDWQVEPQTANIIHVIRDGRDVAFSNQQRKKYQDMYVKQLRQLATTASVVGTNVTAVDIARVWNFVNTGMWRFFSRHRFAMNHVLVRLEDLCRMDRRRGSILNFVRAMHTNMLDDAFAIGDVDGLAEQLYMKSLDTIDEERCHLRKYENEDTRMVREIEREIWPGLVFFNYVPSNVSVRYGVFPQQQFLELLDRIPAGSRVIFTVVTHQYLDMFQNFLVQFDRVVSTTGSVMIVCTPSKEVFARLHNVDSDTSEIGSLVDSINDRAGVVPFLVQYADSKRQIWKFRLWAASAILERGHNLLMSDVDALWMKDPTNLFTDYPHHSIVASQGRFPYELRSVWGVTACMGFILFRATPESRRLLDTMLREFGTYHDDQKALNRAMWDIQVSWKYVNGPSWGSLDGLGEDGTKIMLLSQRIVPRFCKDELKRREKQSVLDVYEDPIVIHCHVSGYKVQWLKQHGLWFV